MIPAAWLCALWLRFNLDSIPAVYLDQAIRILPAVVVIQGATFLYFGLYRGVWRFASVSDLVRIVQAVVVGVSLCTVAVFLLTRMTYIPRASFPLFAGLLVVLLGGTRLTYRWFKDRRHSRLATKNALIVGAGEAGEMLARALLHDPSSKYYPVAFIDDDPDKLGRDVYGIRVLGDCEQIQDVTRRAGADVVVIATPSANEGQMRRIFEHCKRSQLQMRTIPHLADLVSGRAAPSDLRHITIADLLNRQPVEPDWPTIRNELTGRTILVTGGGGSIGSELCRQIARLDPARLVIVDRSELNLQQIELDLRERHTTLAISVVLADVCDTVAVNRLFGRHCPDVVFHAAAYKQVPMLEDHVREAVRVNTLGTQTMAFAAATHSVECFVLVSSDKAVNPVNAMGASKRLAEMACSAVDDWSPSTRFVSVRFGNVLDSAGSVVPLFRKQIASGGPVTVTHRDMKRYFMTIPEACQLIMASPTLGNGGEVLVLDMGEPVPILYLAEQMIRLSGKVPGKDIAIEFVGSRPGEKLNEELFHASEIAGSTSHQKIFLARSRPIDSTALTSRLVTLRDACDSFDESAMRFILAELVPEYSPHPPIDPDRVADNTVVS